MLYRLLFVATRMCALTIHATEVGKKTEHYVTVKKVFSGWLQHIKKVLKLKMKYMKIP